MKVLNESLIENVAALIEYEIEPMLEYDVKSFPKTLTDNMQTS
jgi:hypothetical protein